MNASATVTKPGRLGLRLYVAANSPNTRRALVNLLEICAARDEIDYELTVIDVIREPQRAWEDGVLGAPTLLKLSPGSLRKVMGDLSDRELVLSLLSPAESAA